MDIEPDPTSSALAQAESILRARQRAYDNFRLIIALEEGAEFSAPSCQHFLLGIALRMQRIHEETPDQKAAFISAISNDAGLERLCNGFDVARADDFLKQIQTAREEIRCSL